MPEVVVLVVVEVVVVVVSAVVVDVVVVVVVVVVVGASMMIAPLYAIMLLVISLPFSSLTKRSLIVTGYLPAAQSSGTLYVSVITFAPSAPTVEEPLAFANAYSLFVWFATRVSP